MNDTRKVLLMTEKRDLMKAEPNPWEDIAEPLPERIDPWLPEVAEESFLSRYREIAAQFGLMPR